MADPKVFLPGREVLPDLPLARYLPPLPTGVVSSWLHENLSPGAWVLDPFGASPQLAVEAARAGYRVAVAANNPIARFLLEMQAQPPGREELVAALAELAAARRGDERLEPHILNLYATVCPECGAEGSAHAFIWQREAEAPQAKLIDCRACGHKGEHPTDENDRQRATAYRRGGPHRARALERIAPSDHPDRQHAEEALEAYLPRAVYALFTIINRLDGLSISEDQRRLLSALILSACDRASTLWAHPSGRVRPKQLSAPPIFREYNVWRAIEGAMEIWASEDEMVPVTTWPQAPPEVGGISLYEGRLREMVADLGPIRVDAVLTAFPRPNQAYWTLSALWAGWLWGRDAIGPFASVLRRRRYDWAWHCEALHAGLNHLAVHLADGLPMFGIVGESEAGFNAAVLLATSLSSFKLEGLAMRREEGQLQLNWRKGPSNPPEGEPSQVAEVAAQHLLRQRGEPSPFLHLHAAAFSEMAAQLDPEDPDINPGETLTELRSQLEVALTFRHGFLRYGGTENSLETGHWWLNDSQEARSPLPDRVEIALVRYLLRYPGRSFAEIDQALCGVFRGLLTPPQSLLRSALASYGEEVDGGWRLSAADQPRARRADLRELRTLLRDLGPKLGYMVEGNGPIVWMDQAGKARYAFHLIASAVFADLLLDESLDAEISQVVLPGGRAYLALYKLERDPRLMQAMERGWHMVKFRHLRRLAENKALNPESFAELLHLDPLKEEQVQPPLL